jgi:hypothetical protein
MNLMDKARPQSASTVGSTQNRPWDYSVNTGNGLINQMLLTQASRVGIQHPDNRIKD